ncbi:Hypothetical protein GSB_154426, partial [Giardia duodenalis]
VQDHRRGRHPASPDGPLLQREAQEAQGRDPPDHLRDGSLHPKSRRHLEELHVDVEKLSVRAAFAIAYMAARVSEHLTRLIRRDRPRASHPATRSPPPSAPRGTRAEGTEPFAHRHRGVFRASSVPDGPRSAGHPAGTVPAAIHSHKQQPNDTH